MLQRQLKRGSIGGVASVLWAKRLWLLYVHVPRSAVEAEHWYAIAVDFGLVHIAVYESVTGRDRSRAVRAVQLLIHHHSAAMQDTPFNFQLWMQTSSPLLQPEHDRCAQTGC